MARELPIHNGRMTTDLDANGFKIKNLPSGSGFTQAQADWNQADATAPDFIKNKPAIPDAVAIDATLTQPGAAADAKAVGDALRGGFTEWVCVPDTYNGKTLHVERENEEWNLYADNQFLDPPIAAPSDATNLTFSVYGVTATRHLITPTKTSQLTNDGDGTYAFVKTNDTRLSDARTPTAHTHAIADVTGLGSALAQKANASDLPYRLVEPGKWEYEPSVQLTNFEVTSSPVYNSADALPWSVTYYSEETGNEVLQASGGADALSLDFGSFTATRASLPGHLLDRAGNRVVVSGDTTLTLPAANPGYLRDFLVRLEISGSTVPTITFAAPTGETITYETDGDEFPVPDEAGDWLYSFTESCVSHKFVVALKSVQTVAQGGS